MRKINWHDVRRGGISASIIRRTGDAGFFSNYIYILGHIQYAIKRSYKPVVNMQNYKTAYNQDTVVNETLNE